MSSTTHSKIQRYIYLDSIPSTNEFLSLYLSKNNPSGNMCVYSFHQTKGRGQIGRNWYSGIQKNISLSYLVQFNNLDVQDHFRLNMAVCLSLKDFIQQLVPSGEVRAKWPNDIYVSDKKIAGLLIQNQLNQKLIKRSIIGIGINVNEASFPEELPQATSVYISSNKEYKLTRLIQMLNHIFIPSIDKYLNEGSKLIERYNSCLFARNQTRQFKNNKGELFTGIIKEVNTLGKLLVEINGSLHEFNNHDLELIL